MSIISSSLVGESVCTNLVKDHQTDALAVDQADIQLFADLQQTVAIRDDFHIVKVEMGFGIAVARVIGNPLSRC